MDRVLEQYKDSKFFQEIVDAYHPLAVFITGSRAIGIEHEASDYDLFLLVDIEGIPGPDYPDNLIQFIHKETGYCIHYYTHSLQELFINKAAGRNMKPRDVSTWKGLVAFNYNPELLYIDHSFEDFWAMLMENKTMLAEASLYEAYTEYNAMQTMFDLAKQGVLYPNRSTIYAILVSYILQGEITETELKKLKQLYKLSLEPKNIDGLPKEEKAYYIDKLNSVSAEFESNPNTYEGYKQQADQIYRRIKG